LTRRPADRLRAGPFHDFRISIDDLIRSANARGFIASWPTVGWPALDLSKDICDMTVPHIAAALKPSTIDDTYAAKR